MAGEFAMSDLAPDMKPTASRRARAYAHLAGSVAKASLRSMRLYGF